MNMCVHEKSEIGQFQVVVQLSFVASNFIESLHWYDFPRETKSNKIRESSMFRDKCNMRSLKVDDGCIWNIARGNRTGELCHTSQLNTYTHQASLSNIIIKSPPSTIVVAGAGIQDWKFIPGSRKLKFEISGLAARNSDLRIQRVEKRVDVATLITLNDITEHHHLTSPLPINSTKQAPAPSTIRNLSLTAPKISARQQKIRVDRSRNLRLRF